MDPDKSNGTFEKTGCVVCFVRGDIFRWRTGRFLDAPYCMTVWMQSVSAVCLWRSKWLGVNGKILVNLRNCESI